MRYLVFIGFLLCQLTNSLELCAQKKLGQLKNYSRHDQLIDISIYHQYDLKLKKGTIVHLGVSDFDVRTELTVVSPDGFLVEQVNTANVADLLIFEAAVDGTFQFFVNTIDGEAEKGKYSLTTQLIEPNKKYNKTGDKKGRLAQIKQLIQSLEEKNRAGAAFAIVEQEAIIFEHYFGLADIENDIKINANTVFELASVSKQFTAMAIAQLVAEGKLSVNDDIRKYFPELPEYASTIQVKHLLNHTSGIIGSGYPLALAGFEYDPIDISRVLNFLQNAPEQYFPTGAEFAYSNDGYTLLAELVHRVTEQPFKDWMKQNLFDPLGMTSTVIRDSPEMIIPNRAISYEGDSKVSRRSFDFYAPGGCSVRSSMADLLIWVNYLNKGYHAQDEIFQNLNQLEKFENGTEMNYAYGNFITEFKGLKRISHLGLSAGFTTAVARFPEEDLSFIVLGNDGEFRNYYLTGKIYELYLKEKLTEDYKKFEGITTAKPTRDAAQQKQIAPAELRRYEGSYFSERLTTSYSFQVIDDTLFATSMAYKKIPMTLIGKDTFQTDEDFMEVVIFKRDYNGQLSDCTIYSEDGDYGIVFRKIPNAKKWPTVRHWRSTAFQQRMRDSLEKIEASKIFTGFAVTVFDESETIFQEGYGYADLAAQKAYDPTTLQLIASISKSITGMAVMKAMEMGHFRLDDPINDYLPFKLSNPDFPDDDITIRHLLTHTSSLEDTDNYNHGYVFKKPLEKNNWPQPHHKNLHLYNNNVKMSLSDFLDTIIDPSSKWYSPTEMYIKHRPGTHFEYSNLGFALLGYILERTTKVDFMEFTQKHIFDPLEMTSTTWKLEEVDPTEHATYYLENYNPCPDYSVLTMPDGGLYSNTIDLTKFLQEAIKGYAGRGKILSQASYTEMFRAQSNLIEIEGGLGWDLSFPCCIGHGGNDFGTATLMYFEPRTGLGRILFSNTSMETELIADAFYGMMGLLFEKE